MMIAINLPHVCLIFPSLDALFKELCARRLLSAGENEYITAYIFCQHFLNFFSIFFHFFSGPLAGMGCRSRAGASHCFEAACGLDGRGRLRRVSGQGGPLPPREWVPHRYGAVAHGQCPRAGTEGYRAAQQRQPVDLRHKKKNRTFIWCGLMTYSDPLRIE